jgi:Arc/MetJ family transcription regulator
MATNLQIDDALLAAAQQAGGFKTKKETVNQALADFVRRRGQGRVRELFGTIDFHPGFNPKKLREKR